VLIIQPHRTTPRDSQVLFVIFSFPCTAIALSEFESSEWQI